MFLFVVVSEWELYGFLHIHEIFTPGVDVHVCAYARVCVFERVLLSENFLSFRYLGKTLTAAAVAIGSLARTKYIHKGQK